MPRTQMVWIESTKSLRQALSLGLRSGFSRIPVVGEDVDDIVGIVYLKDLVRRSRMGDGALTLRTVLRPAKFVPEQKRVAELLGEMRTQRFHMAMVVDEHGGTAGLVTLEDLIEEIVGEITDEYDADTPQMEALPQGGVRAPGRTPIDEVGEALGVALPDEEWDTLGGLVFNVLGRVPEQGEAFRFQGLDFRVDRVDGRRITTVSIVPVPSAAEGAGEVSFAPV